jgi:hypothetical protein
VHEDWQAADKAYFNMEAERSTPPREPPLAPLYVPSRRFFRFNGVRPRPQGGAQRSLVAAGGRRRIGRPSAPR